MRSIFCIFVIVFIAANTSAEDKKFRYKIIEIANPQKIRIIAEGVITKGTKSTETEKQNAKNKGKHVVVFWNLGGGMRVGFSEFPPLKKDSKGGFAMWFNDDKTSGFSWEWFDFSKKREYKKRQGGELISVNKDDSGKATDIEFKNSVVFRYYHVKASNDIVLTRLLIIEKGSKLAR